MIPGNHAKYLEAAQNYTLRLQNHEKASQKVEIVNQGVESPQFWDMFFTNQSKPESSKLYGNVAEWNNLIIDVSLLQFLTLTFVFCLA